MTKPDKIAEAFAALNSAEFMSREDEVDSLHWKHVHAERRAEELLAPYQKSAITAARRAFMRDLIPKELRKCVSVSWAGNDGFMALNRNGTHTREIHLEYHVRVGRMVFTATMWPKDTADCIAEGWKVFGVIQAMLYSNRSYFPKDVQDWLAAREMNILPLNKGKPWPVRRKASS